jgi:hypothetical protein
MFTVRNQRRANREAARQARALRRAMSSTTSKAVRAEMLASIGH